MEQKIIFREMLSEVKALADASDNRLTTQEIDEFFANTHLDRQQMDIGFERAFAVERCLHVRFRIQTVRPGEGGGCG